MSRQFGIHFAPPSGFHGARAAAGEHRQPRSPQAPAAAEIQTVPRSLGGNERIAARPGAKQYMDADLLAPLPAGSIFKSSNPIDALAEVSPTVAVAQATIDFLKVLFAILLVAVTGFGIAFAFAYWFFC